MVSVRPYVRPQISNFTPPPHKFQERIVIASEGTVSLAKGITDDDTHVLSYLFPNETTPMSIQLWVSSSYNINGPPLSPWQASLPPSA